MDVEVAGDRIGLLDDGERHWFSLADFSTLDRSGDDTWTMPHRDGIVLNIPVEVLAPEQVEWLRARVAGGKTEAEPPAV
jgi:hypothetical protein